MAWIGALIAGAATIGSGLMSSSAAGSAADQQAGAARQALGFEQGVYNTGQQNLSPYINRGQNALEAISQLYGLSRPGTGGQNALGAYSQYARTPFYTFPLQQGQQTLDRSGAARGLTLSGGQANALQQYGQGYASTNFGNYINALSGLANLGASSSSSLLGQGNTNAGLQAGTQSFIGNAQAQGTINSQSAINNMLSQLTAGSNNSGSSYGDIGNALKGLFSGGGGGATSYGGVDPALSSISPERGGLY